MKILKNKIFITLTAFIIITGSYSISKAIVINVPQNYSNIQSALNAANTGDTINVASGLYKENLLWPVKSGIKLIGNRKDTIIDGGNKNSVITFNMELQSVINNETLIDGFKIQNGTAQANQPYGGGIFIINSSPTIKNVIIMGNSADRGAGLYCKNSKLILNDSVISGNCAKSSGGGLFFIDSNPLLSNTIITNNQASQGPSISFINSNSIILNSTLMDNFSSVQSNISSSIFCYNVNLDIKKSILWNKKVNYELFFSEYSDLNKSKIENTNIRNGKNGIILNNNVKLIWNKENTSKTPKPFGLNLKKDKDDKEIKKENITNNNIITIDGLGGITSSVELYKDGKKLSGVKKIVKDGTFSAQVPLTEGTHTITARFGDQTEDSQLESDPIIITVDTTPPSIVGIKDDSIPKASINWNWKSIDADPKIKFRYLIDKNPISEPSGSYTFVNSASISSEKYDDGKWYLHIQAIDTASNESAITTVSAVLDSNKPVITGLNNLLSPVKTIKWSWKALDKSPDTKFRYLIDQNENSMPSGEFSEKFEIDFDGSDGIWYLHVQAKDSAGNLSEIVTVSAVIDKKAPVITGLFDDQTFRKNKIWSWNVIDEDKQILFRYKIDQQSDSSLTGNYTDTKKASISNVDGKWYLHVQPKDRAGNIGKIVTVSAILDNTIPEIKGLTNDNKHLKEKEWIWTVVDADLNTKCRYDINQSSIFTPENDFQKINKTKISNKDGIWYLHVQAIDSAGNMSKVITVSTILDNTPPVITGLKDQLIPLNEVIWNWRVNDLDSDVVYRHSIDQIYNQELKNDFNNVNSANLSNKEGKWYIHVQAKDSAGNLSEVVSVFAVLDNTPPVITGIKDDNSSLKEKKWSWDSKDDDKFILYRYLINELSDSAPDSQYTNTKSVILRNLNGIYYIHVQAKDRAGNQSLVYSAKTIMDNTPPVIKGLVDDLKPCKSKSWNWTSQDNDTLILYRYSIDTIKNGIPGGQFSSKNNAVISKEDGLFYLHVQAKDSAENISKIVTVSTVLDNTPPVINGLYYDNIPKKSAHWNWQINDSDPDILCRYEINQNVKVEKFKPFTKETKASLTDKNGRWYIHVQAKDNAGNLSEIYTGSVVLDNIPPIIQGLKNELIPVQKKQWQWFAKDNDSIIQYRYSIENTLKNNLTVSFQNANYAEIGNSNGIKYLNVQARDRAGNLSDIYSVSTVLDNKAPVIKGLLDDNIPKKKKDWSWYVVDDDNYVEFRYLIDQQSSTKPCGNFHNTTNISLKDVDGKWFLHVQAKDRAGNLSDVITVSAIIDNTSPSISGLLDDLAPKKEKKWLWHANDQDSDILYKFNVDSKPDSSLMGSFNKQTSTNISGLDGIWYLHIQAKDRAGNLSDIISVKTVLDNTLPVITGIKSDNIPKKSKKWQWSVIDNDTNVKYRYVIDQHADSLPTGSFTNTTNAGIKDLNGIWYLHIQAKDSAGNLSKITSVSAILDNISPLVIGLSNDTIPVKSKKWTWSADEKDLNIAFRYLINQSEKVTLNSSYTNVTSANIENENGKWFIHVQAIDRAGNESDIVTVSTILDNTSPSILGLKSDPVPIKNKTWTWSVNDQDQYVKFIHKIDQNYIPKFTNSFSNINSASISDLNGKWFIHVQAIDRAGNYSDIISVYNIFDNIKPVIKGLSDDYIPKKKKVWLWNVEDNDSKIFYRYVIDQISKSKPFGTFNTNNSSVLINEGKWYLHVQAKDRAGNISDIVTVSAIVDKSPPVILNLLDDDVPKKSKKWMWNIEDADTDILCRISIDQNPENKPMGSFQKLNSIDINDREGKWYLHVQAKDQAENFSEIISVYTILDQTPPVITGITNDNIPKKSKNWSWSVVDNDSNILYRYLIDQNPDSDLTNSFMKSSSADLSDSNSDGKWYLHVQAKDSAGNISNIVSVSALIDNKAPVIKGISDDFIPKKSKSWNWYSEDNDPEVFYRHIISKNKDESFKEDFNNITKAVISNSGDNSKLINDGLWYLHVQAKDRAGNISAIVKVSTIIDNSPPVILNLSNDDSPAKSKKWMWNIEDADPNVLCRISIDQNPESKPIGLFQKLNSIEINDKEGKWYLHVQAKDQAGNFSDIVSVYTILDQTPPVITGITDDNIPKKSKIWNWSVIDNDTNILYRYIIDQQLVSNLTGSFMKSSSASLSKSDGKWYLHVQAKDSAGNISKITTVSAVIDNKNPVIKGISNDFIPKKSKSWNWYVEDDSSDVLYRHIISLNKDAPLTGDFNNIKKAEIKDSDGQYYLKLQAKDKAGNLSEIITVSAIIDNTPPVIEGISNDDKPVKLKKWKFSAKDSDKEIEYRYLIDQKPHSIISDNFTKINEAAILKGNGIWYLHLQAKDRAGNLSSLISVSAVIDNKAPVVKGISDDFIPKKLKSWNWYADDDDHEVLFRHILSKNKNESFKEDFNNNTKAVITNSGDNFKSINEGLWYLHVQAKDRAGNISEIVRVSTIIDNSPPVILNLSNDDFPAKSKKWMWNIEDADPNVLCRISIDQNPESKPIGLFQKLNSIEINDKEGKWYLHVQAKDQAGNFSDIVSVYSVLDQTPPVITGITDDNIPKKSKTWNWSVIDNDTNILYRYIIDQQLVSNLTGSFMKSSSASLSKSNGKWYLHVQAKDSAGNISKIITVSAVIDNKNPVIKGVSNDLIPKKSKSWNWYVEDDSSDVLYRHIISLNKDAPLNGDFNNIKKAEIKDSDGQYYLKLQAKDKAGNLSEIITVSAIIDNTSPFITGISDDDKPVKSKKWIFSAKDSDKEIEFRYLIDQNPHSIISDNFTKVNEASILKGDGIWYLHLQAKDRAGNLSEIIDVYAMLDNTPPQITGLIDDIIPRKKKIWKWKASDNDENIEFRHTINQLPAIDLSNIDFTRKSSSEIINKDGKWYLHVQAKDRAGNLSDIISVYTIINTINDGLYVDLDIHFDSNKEYTKISFFDSLKRVAKILKKYPDTFAVIEAHCDDVGDEESNQKLSEKRANNVKRFISTAFKISSSRLKAVGYGDRKPIDDNSTEEGRRKNRRADAYIYHTD